MFWRYSVEMIDANGRIQHILSQNYLTYKYQALKVYLSASQYLLALSRLQVLAQNIYNLIDNIGLGPLQESFAAR